ncbi:MAG: CRTAC1 family protein [Planctomycetaceae bacterium]
MLAALVSGAATGCRNAATTSDSSAGAQQRPLFAEVGSSLGITFVHDAGTTGRFFLPELLAPGVALFDFDCDGDLDLFLLNSGQLDARGLPSPDSRVVNRLFRQVEQGRFEDVTQSSGLGHAGFGMGVAVGDLNNDGYPDLYVSNFGSDRIYLNRKDGTFADVSEASGIENDQWTTSVALIDFDRDGWLDIYATNYVDHRADRKCPDNRGRDDFCGPQVFDGLPDRLFRNLGATSAGESPLLRFADVSATAGIARQGGPGLGVVCADFNDDRWPDIYVANDHAANFLWINGQDGTFREEAFFRGGALSAQGRPQASMGIACGDVDGNGRIDLLLTHLEGENNALYMGIDAKGFRESSSRAGLAVPSLGFTGFGTQFLDLDNDGDLDLFVANGRAKRTTRNVGDTPHRSVPKFWRAYAEANHVFFNDGTGGFSRFEHDRDPLVGDIEVSRGLATGDIDNDGDLDVVITNTAGPVRIYRNQAPRTGHWLLVRATLPERGGRLAIGARVTVSAGKTTWTRLVQPATSYLSSSDPRVHFGLGPVTVIDRIDIDWPDGSSESFAGGAVDRVRELAAGTGVSR